MPYTEGRSTRTCLCVFKRVYGDINTPAINTLQSKRQQFYACLPRLFHPKWWKYVDHPQAIRASNCHTTTNQIDSHSFYYINYN